MVSSFPEAAEKAGFHPQRQTYISRSAAENLEQYRPGGFHPVLIGDVIVERYQIVHKLGYGAFSTVWLAKDLQPEENKPRYVSIKIVAASETGKSNESLILQRLQARKSSPCENKSPDMEDGLATRTGSGSVLDVYSQFLLEGPNGLHQCIVSEFLGVSVSCALEEIGRSNIPSRVVRRLAFQAVSGLSFIHRCGITHGDLHLGNLLLCIPDVATWTDADVEQNLGKPNTYPIQRHDGKPVAPYAPVYEVEPVDPFCLLPLLGLDEDHGVEFSAQVRIADFGEAFFDSSKRRTGVPVAYAAPEVLQMPSNDQCPPTNLQPAATAEPNPDDTRSESTGPPTPVLGPPSDIWTLAVSLFELLSGKMLFPGCGLQGDKVLRQIAGALESAELQSLAGPTDGGGRPVVGMEERLELLEVLGRDQDEAGVAMRVLRMMLKVDPKERPTAAEVVQALPIDWGYGWEAGEREA
ncbi:kinase-like domain-containing protein [Geopyxis carbonaria]|nr:kinase-like domain-containing protein [Geopyxis carbonaria]